MTPLVSIIIPIYNYENYIAEAIESVLAQDCADWELILVDDGSTDRSAQRVASYLVDSRITYHYQENAGVAQARNTGVQHATGRYLAFLDADDTYLPDALSSFLAVFGADPTVGFVLGGMVYVDDATQPIGERLPWQASAVTSAALDLSGWLFDNYAVPSSCCHRRDWYERVGGFRNEVAGTIADWDLYLRLIDAGCPSAWTYTKVVQYRRHTTNMSSDIQHMLDSQQHVLRLLSQTSAQATAQQIAEAQAWVYVIAAISFYQRNQRKQGDDALVQAVEHQPTLWRQKGIATVEKMCVELPQIPDLAPHLATRFKIPLIVRRVQGRLAMRQFFQAWSDERHDVARQSLWQGVQYNPGWLLNRGIWSFLLKHVLAPRTSL